MDNTKKPRGLNQKSASCALLLFRDDFMSFTVQGRFLVDVSRKDTYIHQLPIPPSLPIISFTAFEPSQQQDPSRPERLRN